jgi:heterodisulfide reductase subunit C
MSARKLSPRFKYEVAREPGGENIKKCFACGICTASCPIREIDDTYNPRKIIRMVLLGLKDEVLSNEFIWYCSGCYACTERCPQGVCFTEVMNAIKNLAIKEGYVPEGLKQQVKILEQFGRLYEIDEFDNRKRQGMGLPVIKPTEKYTRCIIASTGLGDIIQGGKE